MSHAKEAGELLTANVAGFIYVTDVNMARARPAHRMRSLRRSPHLRVFCCRSPRAAVQRGDASRRAQCSIVTREFFTRGLQNARTLTYLSPSPGPLPGKLLLTGQIKWLEE